MGHCSAFKVLHAIFLSITIAAAAVRKLQLHKLNMRLLDSSRVQIF